jgi:flagellar hook assembly protein FlgD
VPTLLPARPNPFGAETSFELMLSLPETVAIAVFDVRGRKVAELVRGLMYEGRHTFSWNGRDENGRMLPSGLYFIRLAAKSGSQSRKIVLVR